MVAPISLRVTPPAGVGLRATPAIVVNDPAPIGDTVATVEKIAAPPTIVEVGKLDSAVGNSLGVTTPAGVGPKATPAIVVNDPAPTGDTTATVERIVAPPTSVELGKLDSVVSNSIGATPDSWTTSPPKGDSEMNTGVGPSFLEVAAEMVEAPRLPDWTLTFGATVAVKAGIPISVVLCWPVAEVEDASVPFKTVVTLFSMMVIEDSGPYPGGTPEDGPLGYGNLVT